jgi:hypothetical protein
LQNSSLEAGIPGGDVSWLPKGLDISGLPIFRWIAIPFIVIHCAILIVIRCVILTVILLLIGFELGLMDGVEIGYYILGRGRFLHLFEVRGGDLEGVEHESGGFRADGLVEQALHGLGESELDGVSVFEDGDDHDQGTFLLAEVDDGGTPGLMVVAESPLLESGRSTTGSGGSDVLANRC